MSRKNRKSRANKGNQGKNVKHNSTQQTQQTNQDYISNGTNLVPFNANTQKQSYVYKGKKNETEFLDFVYLCKLTQKELKRILPDRLLAAGYTDVVIDDGFIYAKGDIPYLVTAHLDTVHKEPVKDFYEYVDRFGDHIISSPQGIGGDDRCGVYMILEIIKEFKPSILFCEDEETGGVGSRKFCKTEFISELENLNYLIELDRANGSDAVFYDCENDAFTDFITENTGYKEAYGSFSDISHLSPACGVASVNLSCGYYHAHTLQEEVNVEEMLSTIEVVKYLLSIEECEQFIYIEARYGGYGSLSRYGYGSYGWFDDDDYLNGYYDSKYNRTNTNNVNSKTYNKYEEVVLCVQFQNEKAKVDYGIYKGESLEDAWFKFFKDNPTVCWNDVLDYDEV